MQNSTSTGSLSRVFFAFDKDRTPVTASVLIPEPNAANSNELGTLFMRQLNDCIMFRKWPRRAWCHSDRWPVNYSHLGLSPDISPDTLRRCFALRLCQRCATALRARMFSQSVSENVRKYRKLTGG